MRKLLTKTTVTKTVGLMENRLFHLGLFKSKHSCLNITRLFQKLSGGTLGSYAEKRKMILLKAFEVIRDGHCVHNSNRGVQDGC